jgi:type I restriction enzyme S subunit
LDVLLPPLPTQKKIAHILSTLDDKIELNRQMNETLEAMAQAIFKSWFVDFDPVHAKAAAKTEADLDQAARKLGISREILDLFPSEFVESEMGRIPKGWEVKPFSEMVNLITQSVKPYEHPDMLWKHFSIPAFDDNRFPIYEYGKYIKSNKYVVDKNAILASKLNPNTPRTWLPNIKENDKAICSTEFMQFVPINPENRAFVYSVIISKYFQEKIKSKVTGTTGSRQRAQPKHVIKIPIIVPSEQLLEKFKVIVWPILKQSLENIEENIILKQTHDALLPKLLSGELDVSEVKI